MIDKIRKTIKGGLAALLMGATAVTGSAYTTDYLDENGDRYNFGSMERVATGVPYRCFKT